MSLNFKSSAPYSRSPPRPSASPFIDHNPCAGPPRDKMTIMLTDRPSYQALEAHYQQIHQRHLRDLFAADAGRGARMRAEAAGLYLDYAKNRITDETLRLLVALAEECGLRARIDAMFRGDKINVTEKRSVLHTALRAPRGQSLAAAEVPEAGEPVHQGLDPMAAVGNQLRAGG